MEKALGNTSDNSIRFMNTRINNLSMTEAVLEIDRLIMSNKKAYLVTPNVDHIVRLEYDRELQAAYKHADLVLTDGKPLIWISRYYRSPIKEKVSGSDLFPRLCELAAAKGYSMFFLGAAEGVAARAAEKLTTKYQGLQVAGTYSPPYHFERDDEELHKIITMIQETRPHILVVALGCPKQEKFIYQNLNSLDVPISLGLGATLDFEAGNVKRAPEWMSNYGLEWLYRLMKEPKRMFRRYLIDDMKILPLIWKYRKQCRRKVAL